MVSSISNMVAYPEPAFRNFRGKQLMPFPADPLALAHLCSRVASAPGDLLSHTQRVFLCHRLGDAEQAFGALVDLFIATGAKARPLRQTLLKRCAPLIGPEHHDALAGNMVCGLTAIAAPDSAHSVLGKGCLSPLRAVVRV